MEKYKSDDYDVLTPSGNILICLKNGRRHLRILIIGLPGSGKSTLACRLSAKYGIPVYHLDTYMFDEGGE